MARPRKAASWLLSVLLVLVWTGIVPAMAQSGSMVRSGPIQYRASVPLLLTNTVTPFADVFLYAVQQSVPAGWTVGTINERGRYQATTTSIVWGPFFDTTPRVLIVQLTPPANASGRITLSGSVSFNGVDAAASGIAYLDPAPPPSGTVIRILPVSYLPGQALQLSNVVALDSGVDAYAVEEILPSGWQLAAASDFGAVLPGTSRLRWGPFLDGAPRTLTATLLAPAQGSGTVTFSGTGLFGSTTVPISGPSTVSQGSTGAGTVTRQLPSSYSPDQPLAVTNRVQPGPGTSLTLIQDTPPRGWTVSQISHGGAYDQALGQVKWGPFLDDFERVLTYSLTPPHAASGTVLFAGVALFDGASFSISGAASLTKQKADSGTVLRQSAACYTPGIPVIVTNRVSPDADVTAYGVVENVPPGWSVLDAGIGSWNPAMGRQTWGPFFDNAPRELTYVLLPPSLGSTTVTFSGNATFGANTVQIGGAAILPGCPTVGGTASRVAQASFVPGSSVDVSVQLQPQPGVAIYFLEETVPPGSSPDGIGQNGLFDSQSGKIKWGPFVDDLPRTLTYRLTTPAGAGPALGLAGVAYFDGSPSTVDGASNVQRNLSPLLSPIPDQSAFEDSPITINFLATDPESPAVALVFSLLNDNPDLFDLGAVTLTSPDGARSLTISPRPNVSGAGSFSLVLTDGFSSVTNHVRVSVTAADDPPFLTAPASVALQQGMPSFGIPGLNLGDPDVGSGSVRLAITNLLGTVSIPDSMLASGGGSTVLVGGTNGSASVVIEGTVPALRAVLTALGFGFPEAFHGEADVDLWVNDLGNTGIGGPLKTKATVRVTVAPANVAPHALPDTIHRLTRQSVKLRPKQLLSNDFDANGDAIVFTGVGASSEHGAVVRVDGPWIIYEPESGYEDTDTFTYTIADGNGGIAVGLVTVLVGTTPDDGAQTRNLLGIEIEAGTGFPILQLLGIPGRTYRILSTDDLSHPRWTMLGTSVAGATGLYTFRDVLGGGAGSRYYRSVSP